MIFLAEATSGLSPEMVGILIGGIITSLIGGGFLGKKVSDSSKVSTTIDGQPLMVRMQDEFVTRREFEGLEARMASDIREMKGLWREALNKIEERDRALTEAIKETAENAYNGRGKLWDKVNDHGARLKSVEDRVPKKAGTGS
jgi:hypothetical protein